LCSDKAFIAPAAKGRGYPKERKVGFGICPKSGVSSPLHPVHYPVWGFSDSEIRRRRAEELYEIETELREDSWFSSVEYFVYDAEHDLYRFPDGEFAFSREYANERRLREEGHIG
jgi:hypothetical protein